MLYANVEKPVKLAGKPVILDDEFIDPSKTKILVEEQ